MKHHDIKNALRLSIGRISDMRSQFAMRPGKDFTRKRILIFETILLYLLQLGTMTAGNELRSFMEGWCKKAGLSSMVKQRCKLKPEGVYAVFIDFVKRLYTLGRPPRWQFIAVDGTKFSWNHIAGQQYDAWRQTATYGRKYMQGVLVMLYDLTRGYILDGVIQPIHEVSEYRALHTLMSQFRPKCGTNAVFIGDRGFNSWETIVHAVFEDHHYLIRTKDRDSAGSMLRQLPLPESDTFDVWVDVIIVRNRKLHKIQAPGTAIVFVGNASNFEYLEYGSEATLKLKLRVVRYRCADGNIASVITNLPDNEFPTSEIVKLYASRWGVESCIGIEKGALAMECFQSKLPQLVLQEVWAKLIVYNFAAYLKFCAERVRAKRQKGKARKNKHPYSVDMTAAVREAVQVIRQIPQDLVEYSRSAGHAEPNDLLRRLAELSKVVHPVRKNRLYPPRGSTKRRTPFPFNHRAAV